MARLTKRTRVVHRSPNEQFALVLPAGIYAYLDRVDVWLGHPLSRSKLEWLERQCRGGVHVRNKPMNFNSFYRQRLQLRQPSHEALQSLSTLNDVLLCYVEFVLDWTFHTEAERDEARDLFDKHHVKKWHGRQRLRFVKRTRYTGPRSAANVLATYSDRESKVTGEVFCVHTEWRIRRSRALRAAGVNGLADLLTLDHRGFWSQRLLISALDLRQLGRLHCNTERHTRRRKPWILSFRYDVHLRAGAIIFNALGSTQAVIDDCGPRFDVKSCLTSINVRHLLPSSELGPLSMIIRQT